jgi:hypothetical protein
MKVVAGNCFVFSAGTVTFDPVGEVGGPGRDRTDDLFHAMERQ